MKNNPLPRLDRANDLREKLLPHCRIGFGEIWEDPEGRHRIGCLDAADKSCVEKLMAGEKAVLAIHDPPYNLIAFEERSIEEFINWCFKWINNTGAILDDDSSLYVWLGADQNSDFQPLPDFMIMMRGMESFKSRSFITLRNQRGYGTCKNWMAVRQELLYYTRGTPFFEVQYTDIPKTLKGYYKEVAGKVTGNIERSKSDCIRSSNVWVDVQQIFYRMKENVSCCYTQKPLKSIDRIVLASSQPEDRVVDFFSHSGSTLISCEGLGRKCNTMDIDPVYCEIAIRRLERFRKTGLQGWQNSNPFEDIDEFSGLSDNSEK